MAGVVLLQAGLALCVGGLAASAAIGWPGVAVALGGAVLAVIAALLPARSTTAGPPASRLDEFVPVWEFGERHARLIAAPIDRVHAAVRALEAREIRGFETLTWLRRGGRRLPPGILNAPRGLPLLDAAVLGGFVILADVPREIVLGLIVVGGHRAPSPLTPDGFRGLAGPGIAKAAINFRLEPCGEHDTLVTTETRVHATDSNSARRFAVYWRIIQPGSAFLRRMWLRAIAARFQGTGRGPT